MRTTYEYQRCVQILVVLLQKFLVIFFGLLPVMFVELATEILRGWQKIFFLAG